CWPAMAEVKPFRALRYDERKAGPLAELVAPPYDVISPEERKAYLERSPYNVVHLTLPDSEEQAADDLGAWRKQGVLVEEDRAADLAASGDSLWRLEESNSLLQGFSGRQLLIADGHHRYETALAFHEEDGTEASAWMMVVLVSTEEQGLTIFPTHRLAESVNGARGTPIDEPGDELPGVVLYRRGGYELLEGDGLDVEVVDAPAVQGVSYTPQRGEAVAAVDHGEAEAAFLLRPTRIEDVFSRAREGQVLPQKTTYFYPKLTSGLLFQPLD